jgi:hypothetical protein
MADATNSHVPVVWKTSRAEADRLLGKVGIPVLDEVVELLQQFAKENNWPLKQINIRYHQDMEFADWEDIYVEPVLELPFEEADERLGSFLDRVDVFQKELGEAELKIFTKAVWFDVDTV